MNCVLLLANGTLLHLTQWKVMSTGMVAFIIPVRMAETGSTQMNNSLKVLHIAGDIDGHLEKYCLYV